MKTSLIKTKDNITDGKGNKTTILERYMLCYICHKYGYHGSLKFVQPDVMIQNRNVILLFFINLEKKHSVPFVPTLM